MLPSLQVAPFIFAGFEHTPALHVPIVWHWSGKGHVTAVPMQVPAEHVSPVVQALPSSHEPDFTGLLHAPVLVLHVPTPWHWSLAVHVTAVPAVHTPL